MNFFKKNFLYFIVFITGAAVLIIEVTATRILAPYFGNTLFTVSSIIGVILGALSLGYYIGGLLADKRPEYSLFFLLIFAAGIFSLLIQALSKIALVMFGPALDMKAGPLISSLILFFAPSLILGMMSPFAIKLKSLELKEVGKVSGSIFFWSTLGSIAGSFAAGFFLIPHFGISKIIITTGFVLIAIGLLGCWMSKDSEYKKYLKSSKLSSTILFIFFFSLVSFFLPGSRSFILQKDGVYSQITVENTEINGKLARILRLDRSLEGGIFLESDELPFEYTRYYSLYEIVNPQAENALFLGGGAYSNPRKLLLEENNIKKVDVAEIEPGLYQIAKKYFKLQEDSRLFNRITDGRRFLQETKQDYDLIFADVYYSVYSIPLHFTTQEFFTAAKNKLSGNGLFLMNIIGTLKEKANLFLLSEIKTFRSVFNNSYFFAVNSPYEKNLQNFIFLGLKDDLRRIDFEDNQITQNDNEIIRNLSKKRVHPEYLNLDSALILTDDFAPVEYLMAKVF